MKIIKGLIALSIIPSFSCAVELNNGEDLVLSPQDTFNFLHDDFPQIDQGRVNTLHAQFNGNYTNIWNHLNNLGQIPTSTPRESEKLQLELASIESMLSSLPGGLEGFPIMLIELHSKAEHEKKEIESLFLEIEDKERQIKFHRDAYDKNSEKIYDFSLQVEKCIKTIQSLEKEIDQLEKVIPATQESLTKHYQYYGMPIPSAQSTSSKQEERPNQRKGTNVFAIKEQSLLETIKSATESIEKAKIVLEENKVQLINTQKEHQFYLGLNETLEKDEPINQALEEEIVVARWTIQALQEEVSSLTIKISQTQDMQETYNLLVSQRSEIMKKLNQF